MACGAQAYRRAGLAVRVATLAIALATIASGCGSSFPLPTERRIGREIPTDKSYQMLATWTGMAGITDILLTQGGGAQLFLLFNHGGTGTAPRGEVRGYPLTRPVPYGDIDFPMLFNPVALCAGGNRVFVLDQGDTLIAHTNPLTHLYGDTTGGFANPVKQLGYYWRVRQYGLLGGLTDTSSFTDTTVAFVRGVAADDQGNVYVSGIGIILVPDPSDARFHNRTFLSRIYKYLRGPRYPGVEPPDPNMPGADWHRDTTWVIEEGSGVGTLVDPRGLHWSAAGGPALYAAEVGNNRAQRLSDRLPNAGFYALDGAQSGQTFSAPTAVSVDAMGYVYVTDTGNRRVLRFGPEQEYVQRVDVEPDASGQPLRNPTAAAANDSVVYVADPGAAEVIRFKRRQ